MIVLTAGQGSALTHEGGSTYSSLYLYLFLSPSLSLYETETYIYLSLYIYIYMYVYIYIYIFMCIYIYICIMYYVTVNMKPVHPIRVLRFSSFWTQPLDNLTPIPIKKGFWATQPLGKILVREILLCEPGVPYFFGSGERLDARGGGPTSPRAVGVLLIITHNSIIYTDTNKQVIILFLTLTITDTNEQVLILIFILILGGPCPRRRRSTWSPRNKNLQYAITLAW